MMIKMLKMYNMTMMMRFKRQAGSFGRFPSSSMKFRITAVRGTRFCGGLAEGNVQSGGGFWHR